MVSVNEHRLDARGLLCPMPVIRTQTAVTGLAPGDTLIVLATDPGTLHDIPAWCRVHGHDIVATTRDGLEIAITIRIGQP